MNQIQLKSQSESKTEQAASDLSALGVYNVSGLKREHHNLAN